MDPDASIILCLEHPGPFLLASAYDFACPDLILKLIFVRIYHFAFIATRKSLQRLSKPQKDAANMGWLARKTEG